MDFRAALGLNVASDATPDDIRGALAIPKTIVVRTVTSIPDPSVICGKFLRLQRYCAIATRMHLEGLDENKLHLRAEPPANRQDVEAQLIFLHALMERAGLEVRTSREGEIRWQDVPTLPAIDTGESERLSDHLHRLIASDPARAWRLEDTAAALGLSTRSLQRYLLAEGGSFSATLRHMRTDLASQMLRRSTASLAEIGFCCGYADQAHFQREFRKVTGQTPRHYRTQPKAKIKTAP
ncbi:helix-turn-helix domain-containing protein [Tritonibacter mobilis]|uniref:helix-turn-helix transcriptional regulator n=1 Tax=Tritonibacter mobilis TaxID=379347 RepID=UPI001444ACB1|nr:helix-turn-helix transcriptional regulator [Rhodobacteraceae bacterium R_SAG5]